MHPFLSYEVAKDIVEEMRVMSERKLRWRRSQNEASPPAPSWDAAAIRLLAGDIEAQQEKVDA